MWWQQIHLLYTLWMFALLYQKRNGYDSFFVAHFEAQHEYQLTKTLEVDAVKVISMFKKKKLCHWMFTHLVPWGLFRIQIWWASLNLRLSVSGFRLPLTGTLVLKAARSRICNLMTFATLSNPLMGGLLCQREVWRSLFLSVSLSVLFLPLALSLLSLPNPPSKAPFLTGQTRM